MRNSAIFLAFISSASIACGIEGMATYPSGSKHDGTLTITTSWNGSDTVVRDGKYRLELGSSACGEKVTVYAGGPKVGEVRLPKSGNATLNIVSK